MCGQVITQKSKYKNLTTQLLRILLFTRSRVVFFNVFIFILFNFFIFFTFSVNEVAKVDLLVNRTYGWHKE